MSAQILPPTALNADGVQMIPIGMQRWRVLDRLGRARGQLVVTDGPDGPRFRARRFSPSTGTFHDLGDFWRASDALECLRLLR